MTSPARNRTAASLLLVAAVVLLGVAFVMASNDVTARDGRGCGSAWRSSRGTLSVTGERTPQQIAEVRVACKAAGDPVVGAAMVVATAGAALVVASGVVAATARRSARRNVT
ncbi:MAG TPA: hypothetical protein VNQ77_11725 [Frankiaceae bacterium]|nr:hypothetical protein [Frankiaceae bacterium]